MFLTLPIGLFGHFTLQYFQVNNWYPEEETKRSLVDRSLIIFTRQGNSRLVPVLLIDVTVEPEEVYSYWGHVHITKYIALDRHTFDSVYLYFASNDNGFVVY